jgi:flagellar basal-body rod modification protein FlgD
MDNSVGPDLGIGWTDKWGTAPAKATAPPADTLASKDTFIKLLVAQLRNQNPLSPADGIEFVSQLSQFTELEQLMTIREDIAAIRQDYANALKQQGTEEEKEA